MPQFVKRLGIIAFICYVIALFFVPSSANAAPVAPPSCPPVSKDVSGKPVTLATYLKTVNGGLTLKTTCTNYYNKIYAEYSNNTSASSVTSFNTRFTNCVGNTTNPITIVFKSIGCGISVAFVPTSGVVRDQFGVLTKFANTHVPFNYVSSLITFGKDSVTAFNSPLACSSSISAQNFPVQLPNNSGVMNIYIPCNPPSAMKPVRSFAVVSLWIGFYFFLWSRVKRWSSQVFGRNNS